MDSDRALVATGSLADAASVFVPFQNLLSQTAEVFLILPFECVAGCAKTDSKDLPISALAMQRTLNWTLHAYAPDEGRSLLLPLPDWLLLGCREVLGVALGLIAFGIGCIVRQQTSLKQRVFGIYAT